ncbi:hypothetical protein B0T17DRAFT_595543 [Bombardia bombarda]|uniref:C2H2-type domain-containing protein n=1 Tax=Bombardia bombarda TaxID=252184 RepID=A0AA39XKZ9_9PEZI|nr:hypothetical protein B0T17DRAFT_595543 [Bombardia bombarda]
MGSLELYSLGTGLHQQGHVSLDYRVRDSTAVKDHIADILSDLQEHLNSLFSVISGERHPFEDRDDNADTDAQSASESDSDSSSSIIDSKASPSTKSDGSFHEIDFRLQSLTEAIDALYRIAARLRSPRNRPQMTTEGLYKHISAESRQEYIKEKEEIEVAVIAHVQYQDVLRASEHWDLEDNQEAVLRRYASPSNFIVQRAGIANARRRQQFIYWKEHADRISREKEPTTDGTPALSLHARSLATSATRVGEAMIKLGDSKSAISNASTVISPQGEKLEWPPPPKQATDTKFFVCPYCHIICPKEYLAKRAWRSHLIHDLKPYHCTYENCQDPNRLYGSRQEWIDHENLHNDHPETQTNAASPELVAAAVEINAEDEQGGTSRSSSEGGQVIQAGNGRDSSLERDFSDELVWDAESEKADDGVILEDASENRHTLESSGKQPSSVENGLEAESSVGVKYLTESEMIAPSELAESLEFTESAVLDADASGGPSVKVTTFEHRIGVGHGEAKPRYRVNLIWYCHECGNQNDESSDKCDATHCISHMRCTYCELRII